MAGHPGARVGWFTVAELYLSAIGLAQEDERRFRRPAVIDRRYIYFKVPGTMPGQT